MSKSEFVKACLDYQLQKKIERKRHAESDVFAHFAEVKWRVKKMSNSKKIIGRVV